MRKQNAFTFFELVIVVAIIAVVVSLFLPILLIQRYTRRNEFAAIESLRHITLTEDVFKHTRLKDDDADGRGEFAGLDDLYEVGFVPTDFASMGGGIYSSNGYLFCVFMRAVSESANGPEVWASGRNTPNKLIVDEAECRWLCFAWPSDVHSGCRAFVATPHGVILETPNEYEGKLVCVGRTQYPIPDAAFFAIGFTVKTGDPNTHDALAWKPLK